MIHSNICSELSQHMVYMSKFKDWIYEKGFTVNEVVELLKVHRSNIFKWTKGIKRPGPKSMHKIKILTKGAFSRPEDLWDEETAKKKSASAAKEKGP